MFKKHISRKLHFRKRYNLTYQLPKKKKPNLPSILFYHHHPHLRNMRSNNMVHWYVESFYGVKVCTELDQKMIATNYISKESTKTQTL